MQELKPILEQIYPLHRTLVSDGTDEALSLVDEHLPEECRFRVETYAPGSEAWTWKVPERYEVQEAYLEIIDGNRVVDFDENPLHIMSYSLPVDEELAWEQLEPHLHYSSKRPAAIPWEFKFYERDWGFCLSKEQFDGLPRDKRYRAVIRSHFNSDPEQGLRVGVGVLDPAGGRSEGAGEVIIASHICHPMQANDDAAGVVTAIGIAQRLAANPLPAGSMSVRFLFCPETIGSICYLSRNEPLIPELKGGIFIEMTGNDNSLILQRSLQDTHLIDRIARNVLASVGEEFREGGFGQVIANDERVINGPGVNVPCISLSRWPYDEYHTTDDNPDIIFEEKLQEAARLIEEVVRVFASNYIPRRNFKGPVFLSGHGLWVDWRDNWDLNRAIEEIMMSFDGYLSVYDIAESVGLDYWMVRDYVERFREKGLVQAGGIPSEAALE
jgi:aminopeptidase-like protein